jgi:hypothetical protein
LSIVRAVTIALGMGLVGLIAGLIFYYFNNGFKSRPVPEQETPVLTAVTPAGRLAGLGYLPSDHNIAFAIQMGPILSYASRTNQEPRELLAAAGIPATVLDNLTALGLTLPQIDHIVGGTSLGDGSFSPRLTLVLALRRPLADEEGFLHKLKAKKVSGKARSDVELSGFPLQLARVSPTVWVFGLDQADFAAVDRGGFGPGGRQFPAGLTRAIGESLPPSAAAWLATDEEPWAEKPGVKLLIGTLLKKPDWLPVLARGRSALVALSFEDPPRWRLFLKTADEATGQQLRTYFKSLAANDDQVRHGGAGDLALYDAPFEPRNAFGAIKKLVEAAGKP